MREEDKNVRDEWAEMDAYMQLVDDTLEGHVGFLWSRIGRPERKGCLTLPWGGPPLGVVIYVDVKREGEMREYIAQHVPPAPPSVPVYVVCADHPQDKQYRLAHKQTKNGFAHRGAHSHAK